MFGFFKIFRELLEDKCVSTEKIDDGAITTDKIADGAITTPKIADGAVTTAKIADGAVSNEKIASGAISVDKLGQTNPSSFPFIPFVKSDGVMEVGKYIDFHNGSGSSADYEPRLYTPDGNELNIMNSNGDFKIWHNGNVKRNYNLFFHLRFPNGYKIVAERDSEYTNSDGYFTVDLSDRFAHRLYCVFLISETDGFLSLPNIDPYQRKFQARAYYPNGSPHGGSYIYFQFLAFGADW